MVSPRLGANCGLYDDRDLLLPGVELVGNAAGETESPHIILPKVILGIGLRIILFYGLAIAVLALVYPHELTPNGQSPFVWVFSHAGIPGRIR